MCICITDRVRDSHSWFSVLFLLSFLHGWVSLAATVIPAPIVVPASQFFEGNDGPWSSFTLRIGKPPQLARVFASTASPDTWTVLSIACPDTQSAACNNTRGGTFNNASSTTWKDQGIYDLGLEYNLNYSGNAEYGIDSVGLGLNDAAGPSLDNQVVAAFVTESFHLGLLGLNVQPTNFTNFQNPIPSFFQTLKNKNLIPSLSWAYTAGNDYSLKRVLGSLIFGGYDASRFSPNSLSFPFAPDSQRDLVVAVQSIYSTETNGKTTYLLSNGILAFVDSTIPYIYLPLDACKQFENTFGLTWDDRSQLYLISDAQHNGLLSRNATITFTLGNSINGGATVSIVLPYAAFDRTASPPLINTTSRYFPLKRGRNDTEYTLGRTFLQEAYLIADYERGNFSISQCRFTENAKPDIQVIHDLNYIPPASSNTTNPDGTPLSPPSSSSSLSIGAIIGIVVGAVLLLLLLALLLYLAHRFRKWPFHNRPPSSPPKGAELDGDAVGHEADGQMVQTKFPFGAHEADSKSAVNDAELEADRSSAVKNELPGVPLPNHPRAGHRELHGSEAANEVEGSGVYVELAGSTVPVEYYGTSPAVRQGEGSRSTTRSASLRDEPVPRRGSAGGLRSPLSAGAGSTISIPTPGSGEGSRARPGVATTTSPLSDGRTASGGETFLLSPASVGSESREASRSRRFEGGRLEGRGGSPQVSLDDYEGSREGSRSREGGTGRRRGLRTAEYVDSIARV